jgi:hypothetical protein
MLHASRAHAWWGQVTLYRSGMEINNVQQFLLPFFLLSTLSIIFRRSHVTHHGPKYNRNEFTTNQVFSCIQMNGLIQKGGTTHTKVEESTLTVSQRKEGKYFVGIAVKIQTKSVADLECLVKASTFSLAQSLFSCPLSVQLPTLGIPTLCSAAHSLFDLFLFSCPLSLSLSLPLQKSYPLQKSCPYCQLGDVNDFH